LGSWDGELGGSLRGVYDRSLAGQNGCVPGGVADELVG